MLVIRRREGEEIVINETTRILVLKVAFGRCQIGIEAPLSDNIRRGELASHRSISDCSISDSVAFRIANAEEMSQCFVEETSQCFVEETSQ